MILTEMNRDNELRIRDIYTRLDSIDRRMDTLAWRMDDLITKREHEERQGDISYMLDMFEDSRTPLEDYVDAIKDGILDVSEFIEYPGTDTMIEELESNRDKFHDAIFALEVHIDSYDDTSIMRTY